jgi:hypothetical protein
MAKQRNYGPKDMMEWKFNDIQLPEVWLNHLGEISEGFRMIIHGKSGHGKTEYVIQLVKMLAMHYGKVSLNNVEQGKSKTLKAAAIRNNVTEIPQGKFTLCDPSQRVFDVWFKKLSGKNTGRVIVLDSLDYMKLTVDQFKLLHEKFKHKSIIIVCWDDPFDVHAKKIKYLCDIKVKVHNFKAKIVSRFGGNKTYTIWKNAHKADYDAKPQERKDAPLFEDPDLAAPHGSEDPANAVPLSEIFPQNAQEVES